MTMSVLLLSTLLTLVAADSCTDCTKLTLACKERLTTEESMAAQTELLVAGLCPGSEYPEECKFDLPTFWNDYLGLNLWSLYWDPPTEWMCKARCTEPIEDTTMDCDFCTADIQAAINELLSDPEGLVCSDFWDFAKDVCAETMEWIIRDGLPLLASAADGSEFPEICNAAVEGTCPAGRLP